MDFPIYSVKQFNDYVAKVLKSEIGEVVIRGEVSGLKIKGSNVYFDIKDDESVLNCYMSAFRLDFPIDDGQELLVTGTPGIYVPYGKYSLNVRTIELQGEGALKKAFEELKLKLQTEGLFEAVHKRSLPRFPETIGIITSGEGAAINDILKVVDRRWGGLKLYLLPVLVQGKNAPDDLVNALNYFNQHHPVDVIIFGRGGGSLEDLQAFNSERVARAIFSSRIPIVAGIGHEHNTSIADLVADVRAATPSNAAEIAVPDKAAIHSEIALYKQRATQIVQQKIMQQRYTLKHDMQSLYIFVSSRLGQVRQLIQTIERQFTQHVACLEQHGEVIEQVKLRLQERLVTQITQTTQQIQEKQRLLAALNPTAILNRGYSITYQAISGKPVTRLADLPGDGNIRTQVSDGVFDSHSAAKLQLVTPKTTKPTAKPLPTTEAQSTLF